MKETRCPTCSARVPVPAGVDEVTCELCLARIPIEPGGPPPAEPTAAPPPPDAPPPGAYAVTPFEAPTGGNPVGVIVPLITGFVGAVVLAVAFGILRGFLWLVIVFPLLQGAAVGLTVGLGARLARFRRRTMLGLVAVVAAVLSVLCIHFLEYLAFLGAPGAPQITFWDYLDLRATAGVQLGKAGGGGGKGTNLGYVGSIIYWSVEALMAALAAAGVARAMVTAPFCEGCNAWKRKRTLGPYKVEPTAALQAVAGGNPAELVAPADGDRKTTLTLYSCPHCGGDGPIDVHLLGVITEGKNTWTCQAYVTYPGEALGVFEAAADACEQKGLKTK